jgi:hypothetical protein
LLRSCADKPVRGREAFWRNVRRALTRYSSIGLKRPAIGLRFRLRQAARLPYFAVDKAMP